MWSLAKTDAVERFQKKVVESFQEKGEPIDLLLDENMDFMWVFRSNLRLTIAMIERWKWKIIHSGRGTSQCPTADHRKWRRWKADKQPPYCRILSQSFRKHYQEIFNFIQEFIASEELDDDLRRVGHIYTEYIKYDEVMLRFAPDPTKSTIFELFRRGVKL